MGFIEKLRSLIHSPESGVNSDLSELQATLGYRFQDEALLRQCLTHRSFCHDDCRQSPSNERLEFLGDSVLGLAVAELLFRDHPELREGELTKAKALLVNETTLAAVARNIRLNEFINISAEEARSGGRQRPSIIADALESVIGGVFLDGGIGAARDLVFRLIYINKREILTDRSQRNFKGELLELVQARGEGMPHYNVTFEEGPDHCKVFHVEVLINGQRLGFGTGSSKKEAEQKAAEEALDGMESSDHA
jgi:ribonuclease-3